MREDRFEQLNVGDEAEMFRTITAADIESFVRLTGDNNPLHVDPEYAATTSFKKPVVHGMLTASFISTMIGTKLPGEGSLWYEQQTRFLAPVRIGEKVRIWAKVRHKSPCERIVVLDTVVYGAGGRRCIEGEAKVKMLQQVEKRENIMSEEEKGAVIISGAGRGIGAAVARELSRDGYPVVVNYVRGKGEAERVVQEIQDDGGRAVALRADVSDEVSVHEMVNSAVSDFQSISGIVNNASSPIEDFDFAKLSWEIFQKHIDVQIKGAFYLTQAVLPHFLTRQQGVVVNIASVVADNIPPGKWIPYNIVKGALITFSRCLAVEYGPKGIRVNCVSPGTVSYTHLTLPTN